MEVALLVNFRGQMAPRSATLQYQMTPLLMKYLTQGCEVICRRAWTKTEMATEVHRGPQPSTRKPDTVSALKRKVKKTQKEPM